jgi:hypothetical protein
MTGKVQVRTRFAIGGALLLVGAVWFGQGVGWIGGSFMSGEAVWAVIGAITMLFALTLLSGPKRHRGAENDD